MYNDDHHYRIVATTAAGHKITTDASTLTDAIDKYVLMIENAYRQHGHEMVDSNIRLLDIEEGMTIVTCTIKPRYNS